MNESTTQGTPLRLGQRIPVGHLLAVDKWRASELVGTLQGSVNVLFEDSLGMADFCPSADMAVVYITEGDLVAGNLYKKKLVKLRKVESIKGIVIAEKTSTSSQYLASLQQFVVLELGMSLIPVTSQTEAAHVLAQLVHVENRPTSNLFRLKSKPAPKEQLVLTTVQLIPKLGEVKARLLLEEFHSLKGICNASEAKLSKVVGPSLTAHIRQFFNSAAL